MVDAGTARYSSGLRIAEAGTNRTHRPARSSRRGEFARLRWCVRIPAQEWEQGARRQAPPSLCSGQKPTPRPRPIILRTTDGFIALERRLWGRNPSLAHCDRQRLLMLREPAGMIKPLFAPGPAKSLRPRPLFKASLAAMSRSSPPGLAFSWIVAETCVGLFGFRAAHPSVLSSSVVGTASMMRSLDRRARPSRPAFSPLHAHFRCHTVQFC